MTVSYLLINVAYLSVLPVPVIVHSKAIAVDFGLALGSLFPSGYIMC